MLKISDTKQYFVAVLMALVTLFNSPVVCVNYKSSSSWNQLTMHRCLCMKYLSPVFGKVSLAIARKIDQTMRSQRKRGLLTLDFQYVGHLLLKFSSGLGKYTASKMPFLSLLYPNSSLSGRGRGGPSFF